MTDQDPRDPQREEKVPAPEVQAPNPDVPADDGYVWHSAMLQDAGLQQFLKDNGITLPAQPQGPEYDALLERLKNEGYASYAARLRGARFLPKAARSTVIGKTVGKATDRSNARLKAKQARSTTTDERGNLVQRKANPLPWILGGMLTLAAGGLVLALLPKSSSSDQQVASQETCEAPNVLNAQGKCVPIVASPTDSTAKSSEAAASNDAGSRPNPSSDGGSGSGSGSGSSGTSSGAQTASAGPVTSAPDTAQQTRDLQQAYENGRASGRSEAQASTQSAAQQAARAAYEQGRQNGVAQGRSSAPTPSVAPGSTRLSYPPASAARPAAAAAPLPLTAPNTAHLSVTAPSSGAGAAAPRPAPTLTFTSNASAGNAAPSAPKLAYAPASTVQAAAPSPDSQGRLGADASTGSSGGSQGGASSAEGARQGGYQGARLSFVAATNAAGAAAPSSAGQMTGALAFKSAAAPLAPSTPAATSDPALASASASASSAAGTGAAPSLYGPYRPYQTIKAVLESSPVVIEGVDTTDLPVIARSEDGRKWVGYPTNSGPNRMIIRFAGYVDEDNRSLVPVAAASYDLTGAPGLQANSQDLAPDLVRNLIRRAATGTRDYATAELNAKTTVVTNNAVVTTNQQPNIWTTVAGSALGVFDLPADQKTFYRGAYLPVGTPLVIMVGAGQKK